MKKNILPFLLTIFMNMIGTKSFAYIYDIAVKNDDGLTLNYIYINDAKELDVTSGDYIDWSNIVIPKEVTYMNRTRKVTSIGYSAFSECRNLTSITIPNSINSISSAFAYCSSLEAVNISDLDAWCNITFESSNANPLSHAHHLYLNGEEITDLIIPNNLKTIKDNTFCHCKGLNSVVIPESVTSIGNYAFYDCPGLTNIFIPNSITSIGTWAFMGCTGLNSLIIPNSVTTIGSNAFGGVEYPIVISKIMDPSKISKEIFSLNTYMNATLYVPKGTLDKYRATNGWKKFVFIEEGDGEFPSSENLKCAKPVIAFKNGEIVFSCKTEGVEFISQVIAPDAKKYTKDKLSLNNSYKISVYATKEGYADSEIVIAEIPITIGKKGDLNGDDEVNVADHVKLSDIIMGK